MSECKLNHKQRRKIQRREKRRKKRREKFLSNGENARQNEVIENSASDDDCARESSKSLPEGCMTNYSIIDHFKKLAKERDLLHQLAVNDPWLRNTFLLQNPKKVAKKLASSTENTASESPQVVLNKETNQDKGDGAAEPDHVNASTENPQKSLRGEIDDLLTQLDEEVEQWHNPFAPEEEKLNSNPSVPQLPNSLSPKSSIEPPVDERQVCLFYAKVGACKYGERCSRRHVDPAQSETLLFTGMFQTFAYDIAEKSRRQGVDHDVGLEYSDNDLYDEFLDFFGDIGPEFEQIGLLKHLFVCCNRAPHLCGNVYVQYDNVATAQACFEKMNLRYYNGKPLTCRFVSVDDWSKSICGFHSRNGFCSRGDKCNFLHVFWNPEDPRPLRSRRPDKERNHKRKRSRSTNAKYDDYKSHYESRNHSCSPKNQKRDRRSMSRSQSRSRKSYSSHQKENGLSENKEQHSSRSEYSGKHKSKKKKSKKEKKSKKKKKRQNENNSE